MCIDTAKSIFFDESGNLPRMVFGVSSLGWSISVCVWNEIDSPWNPLNKTVFREFTAFSIELIRMLSV